MLCEEFLSVLFGKIAAKRTKNGEKIFRACGRDQGRCPWNLQAFEKA